MREHLLDNSLIASALFSPGPAERFILLQIDDRLLNGPARWALVVAKGLIQEGRPSNLIEMRNRVDDPLFRAYLVLCSRLDPMPIRQLKDRLERRFLDHGHALPVSDYEWILRAIEEDLEDDETLKVDSLFAC